MRFSLHSRSSVEAGFTSARYWTTSRAISSPGILCTTMKDGDVTETLDLALQASGFDRATIVRRAHSSNTNSRRIAPSVCSDLISDRDRYFFVVDHRVGD
jgi:hypothetical protein